ncbi:Sphingolipid C4-hydroxylase SUR2 [Leucoagaricus sp. SymC.cos]|nr:Sphingolipid C4-hydroxylase SUR2 [Leucoagaricus sp. SymC.cos]
MTLNITSSAVSLDPPFYYSPRHRLIDNAPDHLVTLAVPIIAYWSLSLIFHVLDMSGWKWLDKYRIHESEEVKKRNLVGRTEVVLAVIFQQVIQTLMGLVWLEEEIIVPGGRAMVVKEGLKSGIVTASSVVGKEEMIAKAAWFMYWWGVPIFQFFAAMFFIDTWQYFLHRAMHTNKFLYKSFHSWHHRLYVPYAFGSLYNHPVEGFLLDTLGAALAEWLTGMSTRQAMVLFIVSTFKTVDDHCGYSLPWDPLQMFSGNNADYHDIHHQVIGIKSNFAQPFFVHWDTLLGTKMTREDMERRKKKSGGKTE